MIKDWLTDYIKPILYMRTRNGMVFSFVKVYCTPDFLSQRNLTSVTIIQNDIKD